MLYNVKIKNEQGEDIGGLVTLLDADGDKIGETVIAPAGTDIDPGAVELMDHYLVTSDGYNFYGGVALYDTNIFTLVRRSQTMQWVFLAVLGGLLLGRLIKL